MVGNTEIYLLRLLSDHDLHFHRISCRELPYVAYLPFRARAHRALAANRKLMGGEQTVKAQLPNPSRHQFVRKALSRAFTGVLIMLLATWIAWFLADAICSIFA